MHIIERTQGWEMGVDERVYFVIVRGIALCDTDNEFERT
jgi:hypothetical protein